MSCGTRSSLLHMCDFQIQILAVCPVSQSGHTSFYTVVALKQRRQHGLKHLHKWDFYLLTLPCSLPHPPFAPKANPQLGMGSVSTSTYTLRSVVGSVHPPPKLQPSVPVTWRPASHVRSLPDPGSLVAKQACALQGACSVLPPPPCSVPSWPRALSLLIAMCWRHPCAAACIYPYICKNMYCNLHFLFLSHWFIYARETCLHLPLPSCRSLGFPCAGFAQHSCVRLYDPPKGTGNASREDSCSACAPHGDF